MREQGFIVYFASLLRNEELTFEDFTFNKMLALAIIDGARSIVDVKINVLDLTHIERFAFGHPRKRVTKNQLKKRLTLHEKSYTAPNDIWACRKEWMKN